MVKYWSSTGLVQLVIYSGLASDLHASIRARHEKVSNVRRQHHDELTS